ncbi:hypothetical protein GKZ28_01645 [Clostridium chromiireducens]|uniref:Uncharacterized protein n=1 Tax=Clostridium chromiireducens TaxID=225345 RepID=A0A964RIN4_9CLOT|nr:hypothetical protein [Clostridium chromiireducens]MVX62404.1 hypothetical protein [Clostridium chromiireducens]
MQKFFPLLAIILLCIIGCAKTFIALKGIIDKRSNAMEFLNKFREFANGLFQNNIDNKLYQWLKLNSSKMQKHVSIYGISCDYKPAGANYIIKGYQVILNGISNMLTEYRQFGDLGFGTSMIQDEAALIDDTLLTYIGELDSEYEEALSQVKNPLIWLREGVRFFVVLPISLMYWSGLIRYRTYSKLTNNFFVKFIAFLVAVIGLVSSIVTIVTGYEAFWNIIDRIKK